MEEMLFILNPVAGGGKAKKLLPLIEEKMDSYGIKYKIIETKEPKEAIEIARNYKDIDTIVAVGGDGTVNEVAKGLILRGSGRLGIIPGGTGNDMAKSLNIPKGLDEALDTIIEGYEKDIDIGKINGEKFLNIASIGFDAEVVLNNQKIKKVIRSGLSYAISVVYSLINYRKKQVEIRIDDKTLNENIVLMAVGNGKYYGGGMKILPMAEVDNGLFSICLVSKASNFTLLKLFPTIFKGSHIKLEKYVQIYHGKKVQIKSRDGFYLNIDGEIHPQTNELEFVMAEDKLRAICGRAKA